MAVCRFCDARVSDSKISCPNCGAVLDLVRHAEEASKPKVGPSTPAPQPTRETSGASQGPQGRPAGNSRISPETEQKLAELVARGELIQAIKAYRQLTGASLSEAKDYVESFGSGAGKPGCAAGCLKSAVGCFVIVIVAVFGTIFLAAVFG
jgi:ribosomal protein L7/L12